MNPVASIEVASNKSEERRHVLPLVQAIELEDVAEDGELLAIYVATGCKAAIEQLIRRHSPMVAGVIGRMLVNQSDAEDAFQGRLI